MDTIEKYLIDTRRYLHQNPEIGYDCFNTSQFIEEELKKFGFKIKKNIANTGLIGILENSHDAVICLRADMDALPIEEETNVAYKSLKKNTMHACGHDAHTAILLAVCKFFGENKSYLKHTLKVIFQPAEEGPLPGGAIHFVEHVKETDAFFALHVTNEFAKGTIAIKSGVLTAAPDVFEVTIHGIGTHASTPKQGKNPLFPAADIILLFNALAEKYQDQCVLSTTVIHCGEAFNIISDKAILKGTLRTIDEITRENINQEMNQILDNIMQKYQIKIDYTMKKGYDRVNNDIQMTNYVIENAKKILGEENIIYLKRPNMFGEDFSYLLNSSKGAMFFLGTQNKEEGHIHPLHSPFFNIDEKALKIGYEIMKNLVINFTK